MDLQTAYDLLDKKGFNVQRVVTGRLTSPDVLSLFVEVQGLSLYDDEIEIREALPGLDVQRVQRKIIIKLKP